jgi:twitching motility protein PilT
MDGSYNYADKDRYRVNCYVDTNGYSIALRIIPRQIPTLEEIGLSDEIKKLCSRSK